MGYRRYSIPNHIILIFFVCLSLKWYRFLKFFFCKLSRKSFQEEIQQKVVKEEEILLQKQKDEEEFRLLLEENKKENERVKIIR